jgi:hypothetical protein
MPGRVLSAEANPCLGVGHIRFEIDAIPCILCNTARGTPSPGSLSSWECQSYRSINP